MTLALSAVAALAMPFAPTFASITPSHADFVDWARSTGQDARVVEFLANRQDGAGANPRQWSQMSGALQNADYQALRPDQKRQIAVFMIGQQAFDAYVAWAAERAED